MTEVIKALEEIATPEELAIVKRGYSDKSREIINRYYDRLWDKLSPTGRKAMLEML